MGDIPPMYMIGARIKVRETVSAALVDGNAGFGAVVGQFSMELAMQKASMCNYNGKQGQLSPGQTVHSTIPNVHLGWDPES